MLSVIIYLLVGTFAGVLSGLFGIGGGVVVVPALAIIFSQLGVGDGYIMHMAAGTSLTIMVVTTFSSMTVYSRRGSIQWSLYRKLLPGVLFGVVCGALIANYLHSNVLRTILGLFLLFVSIRMFYYGFLRTAQVRSLPNNLILLSMFSVIGCFSGMLGIGSGSMSVPFLSRYDVSMRQIAGVSVACAFPIAIVGAISFIITGWQVVNLPWTTGYVYWPAFLFVAMASLLSAPLGVMLSHRWSSLNLKRFFAFLMLALAGHLLFF